MFRKGGLSQETGIMSGLDRRGYAQGSYAPRVGYADGPRIPPVSDLQRWIQQMRGTSGGMWDAVKNKLRSTTGTGQTSTTAQNVARPGWKGKAKTALDFVRKGAGMARTGIGSLMSNPLTLPVGALAATAASPFIAQAAATGQRKKGLYTPEGESYDPETGEILGGPNVDEMGFTEQELAGSDAFVPGRNLTPAEMKEARTAKLKELQKEQISARIKRGDPVDANIAQDLGINIKTGTYDKDGGPSIINGDKFTGDVESDLMRAYKEYAPIFEKELGISPEDTKKQLWMQLAKFGAGVAAQPGGDLVGAIGKAAEKPLEGAGEVVKDVSTAKRQAKLLALQTAISENKPGSIGTALKDIAKAYNFKGKDKLEKAAAIYEKWQTRNTTAVAADVSAYRKFAEEKGVNPEGFQRNIRNLLADPNLADLVGQFNEVLPEDIEDATNKEYYITTQGQLVRVVDGEILTSKDPGFKDKPKKK